MTWGREELMLRADLARHWQGCDAFSAAFALSGPVARELEQRQTLAFQLEGRRFFVKRHRGVSWKDVFKNLLQGRLPVVSARNEYLALERLRALGLRVPVVAGYGRRGWLPARFQSFLVTEDVGPHSSLEQLCRDWPQQPPSVARKRALLQEVADIARRLHAAGICHRDFYLCHFLQTSEQESLVLIDLHRALIRRPLARRWIVKDLGSLYFSALEAGLTRRDLLRFVARYRQRPWRSVLAEEAGFWHDIRERALRLYRRGKRG